jgi:hypothetical protein
MNDEIRKHIGYLPEDHGQTFFYTVRSDSRHRGSNPSASSASRLNTHQPLRLVAAVRPSATRDEQPAFRFGVGRWL